MRRFTINDIGNPAITRDGRRVTNIHHLPDAKEYPIVGVLEGKVAMWNDVGEFVQGEDNTEDLFLDESKYALMTNFGKFRLYDVYETLDEARDAQQKLEGFDLKIYKLNETI